ncbi:orotidine-5'-phosphate decarboxylase [Periconia macrospinosa]|uniref:Orotidine 5'-phosphate decarboxylase n=1 Tax=Periconia macrospinosa TaxID=97972 RepID=A0A2V1DEZ6_9PLEO|nr:orotidine-5'-phosphate decarboxylase [Periconia macrospinosa]
MASTAAAAHPATTSTYRSRATHASTGPLAAYLLSLMSIKQTNLCLSADVETSAELLALAEDVGDSICILKTHCDIVTDWSDRTARALQEISHRKFFIIFEDRKFADIGETVQKQYTSGYHQIASWAEITNAHILPGPAIVTALHKAADAAIAKYNTGVYTTISADPRPRKTNGVKGINEEEDYDDDDEDENNEVALSTPPANEEWEEKKLPTKSKDRKQSVVSVSTTISLRHESISPRPDADFHPDEAFNVKEAILARLGQVPFLRQLLLLAEMSSEGHLMTPEYQRQTVEIARANRQFVMGFIAQRSLNTEPEDQFITMTPGCKLPPPGQEGQKLGDALGQQYNTPRKLILEQGCDVIIVGRGIVRAQNRPAEAERYRLEGWKAYVDRVGANHR